MAGFEYDYVTLLALLTLCKEFISISLAFPFGRAKTITIGYVWTLFCFFKMEKGKKGATKMDGMNGMIWRTGMTTMKVKSVGTFPVILLKLETSSYPPQTKLNLEQNGWK